jgi:hypothetical protein
MKFSKSKHFKAQDGCNICNGSGSVEVMEALFNVRNMDFDIITDRPCPKCLEQSKEDFYSYLEDIEN